jgi:NADH dehydrogenase
MTELATHAIATIFGGSGFIGRHVVRKLAGKGYRLRVAVRRPHVAHFLKPMGRVGQIQLLRTDLNDESAISRALDGAEIAINLVGILYQRGRQRFDALHAEAPARIGGAAKAAGVRRLVHISAIGAAADAPSHYGRSKWQGEAKLREAFPAATILRPSIVFGPEDDFFNRFASMARLLSVLPRFVPAMPLIGGGRTRFQPVYVEDVAEAVLRALEDPATEGHIYELGGPRVYTFRELLDLLAKETGRHPRYAAIPFWLATLMGALLGLLPKPILTVDQVRSLRRDNVVGAGADAPETGSFADLGIAPTALEAILPVYLWRFRKTGQFETLARA